MKRFKSSNSFPGEGRGGEVTSNLFQMYDAVVVETVFWCLLLLLHVRTVIGTRSLDTDREQGHDSDVNMLMSSGLCQLTILVSSIMHGYFVTQNIKVSTSKTFMTC